MNRSHPLNRSSTIHKLATASLALVVAVGIVGCSGEANPEQLGATTDLPKMSITAPVGSQLEKIMEQGFITVGVKYDVPQFGLSNPISQEVEGFEVDLAKYIGARLFGDSTKAKLVEALNANRVPMLDGDKADVIISQMTITPERKTQVLFTDVYYLGQLRILAEKATEIASVPDLGGKTVCTSAGSTAIPIIERDAPTATIVSLASNVECFDAVTDGRVDAEVADDSSLVGFIVKAPTLELKGEPLAEAPYGAAVKNGNDALQQTINDIIAEYKSSGEWQKSYDKWMKPLTKMNVTPPPAEG